MNRLSLIGALIGAAMGAALWTLFTWITELEHNYIALFVGFATGLGSTLFGGASDEMGYACAVLAVVAMLVGKVFAFGLIRSAEVEKQLRPQLTQPVYEDYRLAAESVRESFTDREVAEFMAYRGFSSSSDPAQVSHEEMEEFRAYTIADLLEFREAQPDYETWRASLLKLWQRDAAKNYPAIPGIFQNMSFMSIMFLLIGAVAAFSMARRSFHNI